MSKTEFKLKEGSNVFAPRDLVQLARPGTGVANSLGDLVFVPVSKYSLDDKKNHKWLYIAPVESTVRPLEVPLTKGGQAFWLDSRTIAHVVPNEDKGQDLYAIAVRIEADSVLTTSKYISSFPTTSSTNFQYVPGSGRLVFSDEVYEDGNLTSVNDQDKAWENRGTTAFVYDDTYVRHWDTWRGPKHSSLFSVELSQKANGDWALGERFVNVLQNTKHKVPVDDFDDFDVSSTYIVYTTKDAELPEAWHTKQNVYIIDIDGASEPKELTSGKQGATHSPVFSKDGSKVAYLELDEDGYESDRAKIVIYDLITDVRFTITQEWDRSPSSLAFSPDDKFIYLTAGEHARVKIFVLPVPETPSQSTTHPKFAAPLTPLALTHSHAASGIQPLPNGRLLFSQSSFVKPNDVYVLRGLELLPSSVETWAKDTADISKKFEVDQLTQFTRTELQGKNLDKGEEFWFEGAEDKQVQGWVLKPNGWSEKDEKKWPAVLIIHGGPQGANADQWSNRWNPNVFAQQGYLTVEINPTGSTTFGQDFTDAIKEDWGGKPFVDLQKGWKYILDNYPQIDSNRTVAAGASYGGYAINWIQSNPEFGFGFKALFCHDGVFDTRYNGYSTDELFFFNHEFGGHPWSKKAGDLAAKFSPANYVHKWSTPQLIVHGSKDYRLPETEGIAAFHALQQRGVPSRLVIFPDENHWVLNPGNSLKWHYEVFRWFDQFVGQKS